MLSLDGSWIEEGHRLIRWSPDNRGRLAAGLADLRVQLRKAFHRQDHQGV